MIFASNSRGKSYENEQNPYFSDFECNFRLLGGVFHKCSKSKYQRFRQNNFLAPILAVKKTPFTFFCFSPHLHANFFKKKNLPILGELRKLHAKIYTFSVKIDREINYQCRLLYDSFFTNATTLP